MCVEVIIQRLKHLKEGVFLLFCHLVSEFYHFIFIFFSIAEMFFWLYCAHSILSGASGVFENVHSDPSKTYKIHYIYMKMS